MNNTTQSYIDIAEIALRIGDNIEHSCGDIKISNKVTDLMGVGKYNKAEYNIAKENKTNKWKLHLIQFKDTLVNVQHNIEPDVKTVEFTTNSVNDNARAVLKVLRNSIDIAMA